MLYIVIAGGMIVGHASDINSARAIAHKAAREMDTTEAVVFQFRDAQEVYAVPAEEDGGEQVPGDGR